MARPDSDRLPRGSGVLLGGLVLGTALILLVVFGGGFSFGSRIAPDVRIDEAPSS